MTRERIRFASLQYFIRPVHSDESVYNQCFFFGPQGDYGMQGKLHVTRFESEDCRVSPNSSLKVFETNFGKVAVAICYDVEFSEIARGAAGRAHPRRAELRR